MSESDKVYSEKASCNKCGGENAIEPNDYDSGVISEAFTQSKQCGHTDYWAHGHFESGQYGLNAAKRY